VPEHFQTIVVGAGQAGLSTSYHLTQAEREHVVLERGQIADTWRTKRWDGFYLNTPRWSQQLPGHTYDGPDPDAFSSLQETIAYLDAYAASFDAPVRTGSTVTALRRAESRLAIEIDDELVTADNVVVATGAYQKPTPAPLRSAVPDGVLQLHSDAYRRPEQLPEGAVLVVGGGQSGCQITDELITAGRTVYLSVGRCPWLPRRYRGREILLWAVEIGFMDQTVDTLPSAAARLACNPPISGNDGGHDCHPRWLEARGAVLVGRLQDIRSGTAVFGPSLDEDLAFADGVVAEFTQRIDDHIAANGLDAPKHEAASEAPSPVPRITDLDLHEAGVTTILWSNGYRPDFDWIEPSLFDAYGWPLQRRGVTEELGLYFVGLHWLHKRKSSLLFGVGEDAAHVVSHIVRREEP
jgi:putative flavoprotein involved in K+ transport